MVVAARRLALAAALGALACAVPASADAVTTATTRFNAPLRAATTGTPGDGYEARGFVSAGGGRDAGIHWTWQGNGTSFRGSFVLYDARGTLYGTSRVNTSASESTSRSVNDRLRVTGGTGYYRRARGTLSVRGHTDVNTANSAERLTGEVISKPQRTAKVPAPRPHPFEATLNGRQGQSLDGFAPLYTTGAGLTTEPGFMFLRARQRADATVPFTYYDGLGSLRGAVHFRSDYDGKGTVVISDGGHGGRISGGTGRYRRASSSGGVTVSGTRDRATGAVTLTLRGTLSY